jgi:hypothetical protein
LGRGADLSHDLRNADAVIHLAGRADVMHETAENPLSEMGSRRAIAPDCNGNGNGMGGCQAASGIRSGGARQFSCADEVRISSFSFARRQSA